MKKMSKLTALVLAVMMVLGLTACSADNSFDTYKAACRKRPAAFSERKAAWQTGLDSLRKGYPVRHEKCHFRGACLRK